MYLHIFDATLVEDKIYFADADFNAFFVLDLREKQIEYKTYFKKYAKYKNELYAKQILYGDKIYFIPRFAKEAAVYDLQTGEMAYIEIPVKGEGLIRDAFIENNHLWMLCAGYPAKLCKVDLTTNKYIILYLDWKQVAAQTGYSAQTMSMSERQSTFGYAKQIERTWWMFAEEHGHLVIYDWKKGKTNAITFPYFKNKRVTGNVQEKVWLMARDESRVLEYDFLRQKEKWIDVPAIDGIPGDIMRIIVQERCLMFVKQNGMVVASKDFQEVESFRFSEKKNLMSSIIVDEQIILFPVSGKDLIVFNPQDHTVSEYPFVWDEKLTNENLKEIYAGCLGENICQLQEFVEVILSSESNGSQGAGESIGEEIWSAFQKEGMRE